MSRPDPEDPSFNIRPRLCRCGSGLPSEELLDGHGIYLCRVCPICRKARLSEFREDILSPYDTDDPIEEPD